MPTLLPLHDNNGIISSEGELKSGDLGGGGGGGGEVI